MDDGVRRRFELKNRAGQHIIVDDEVLSFKELRNMLPRRLVTIARRSIESVQPIGPGIRIRTAERSYDVFVGLLPAKVARARSGLISALTT